MDLREIDYRALFADRRVLLAAAGGAAALVGVLGLSIGFMTRGHGLRPAQTAVAAADAPHSLQVEMTHTDPGFESAKPLRCFVDGAFVGMTTLADCAKRNGLDAGALDVGLDPTGAIAAMVPGDFGLLQLPDAPVPPSLVIMPDGAGATPAPFQGATAGGRACWRYTGDWRRVSESLSLDECVQALFAGRCERRGAASYGRWGTDTLRLVTGKVEQSADSNSFRTLVRQSSSGGCAIPHLR